MDFLKFAPARRVTFSFLGIPAIAASLFAPVTPSLGTDKALRQRIAELGSSLEADKKNIPHAVHALQFLTRLKDADKQSSPDMIASLQQNLGQQNFSIYHESLYGLVKEVSAKLTKRNMQARQKWAQQIDAFRAKVRQSCIDGAPTLEFETLQVEAAGLKLKRPQSLDSSTEWAKMESGKLDSTVKLIHRWLDYRSVKDKGDLEYTQSKLEYFARDPTPYPILDKQFFDEKVKSILRERGVTETKHTEYRGGKKVTLIQTQPIGKPGQISFLAKRQQEIIAKLEAGNWDARTVLGYAAELKALEKKEQHFSLRHYTTNRTIEYFGECLLALEKNDLPRAKAGFLLTSFGRTPIPVLKPLERKVMVDVFPAIYPNSDTPRLENDKPLSQYQIELLSAPKSMDDLVKGHDLVIWFAKPYWVGQDVPAWKKSAESQYRWLSRARLALESRDYPQALHDLRVVLYDAVDSGPASAQTLAESEIRKLTQSHPELFTPSIPISERLTKAEEKVRELESIIKKTQ